MNERDDLSAFEKWEVLEAVPAAAEDDAARRLRLQQEAAAIHEAARAQGYAAGLEEGRRAGQGDCARVKDLLVSLGSEMESLDFRVADLVLELALDVARQVVAGELAVRPERILEVVNLALKQLTETTQEARLLLHPEDAALVRPQLEGVLDRNRLRVVEDIRIERGGCLIETPLGDLDATLTTRWRQVVQVLGSNRQWLD